jgi:dCMP deaminase
MNIHRLPWDEFFMLQAHLTATRSTCDRGPELLFDPGRHGVGCVLVRDRRVIAGGYNGSPPGEPHCTFQHEKSGVILETPEGHIMVDGHCIRTVHSEMNAIIQCALDGVSPAGASLYTTASPCYDCAKVIIRAQIKEVFYGQHYDSRYGFSGPVHDMLKESGIHLKEIISKLE